MTLPISNVKSITDPRQIGVDAGGRTRTAHITTLGDFKIVGADRSLLIDSVGTGSGSFSNNKYIMSAPAGKYMIRQSHRFHPYFSGKSQIVECTFYTFQPEAGVVKRVGYFSSNAAAPYASNYDGFWLESGSGKITLKAARDGVETLSVEASAWNRFFPNTYDWSMFTVVMFDFLWLGGAVLRLWLKTDQGFVLCHEFNYSGTAKDTFTKSPSQPVRYEIRGTSGDGTLHYVCAQVATEGSTEESGSSRAVDTGSAAITLAAIGTRYPLKAIRKKTSQRDVGVRLTDLAVFASTANDLYRWELCLNPTLSAGLTYSDVSNSAIQEASGNGTITVSNPGTVLSSGYMSTDIPLPVGLLKENYLSYLGSSILDVMDEMVLVITPITGGVGMFGGITVKEY